jgi:thiol-disulfide isomerase/thioredoxin
MTARLLVAVAVLVALAGCTSAHQSVGSSAGATSSGGSASPALARLVAAAHLAPCPTSTASGHDGLPDTTLSCLGNGPAVHVNGLSGKPTVVNVWGSWCIPCQSESSYLSMAYDKDKARVSFLGVDTQDENDSALDFAAHARPPMRYPSVVDSDKQVLLGLHVAPGPPETAFVSTAGRLVHVRAGAYTSLAQLQHDIATYLHIPT